MAIISQDVIKLGCSGGQGKIQIQTLFDHATKRDLQLRLRRTSVENPRQRRVNPPNRWRVNLYKLVHLWRDWPCFMQNKANLRKIQVDVRLIVTRDYEKKIEQDIW